MSALSRLQSAILFQAAEDEAIVSKLSESARQFIAAGALAVVAITASGQAQAQTGPLTPSNCMAAGSAIGGIIGGATPSSSAGKAIGGIVGALAGAAAGNWLCSPSQRSLDSSYAEATRYGMGQGASVPVDRQAVKAPLSITERERLDALTKEAIDAKYEWKKALWMIDQARQRGFQPAVLTSMETEAAARRDFEVKRGAFATTVARLHNGGEGIEPKAVGRYLEIAAALLELSTESRTSFEMLAARDQALQERSPTYMAEANKLAQMRNR